MAQVVKLNVLQDNGKEEIMERTITSARVFQYRNLAKIAGRLSKRIKEDPALMETIQVLLGVTDDSWFDEDTGVLMDQVKSRLQTNAFETIGFALEHLPDELFAFLSVAANIDENILNGLDEQGLFDVLNAIIEENDIERLMGLAKNFFGNLQGQWFKEKSKEKQKENLKSVTNK